MTTDPYEVLGIDASASPDDIRHAYFRLVRQYPPEAHPEEFKRIRSAYETLRSPLRRASWTLAAFDESVAEIDLGLIARATDGEPDFDPVAVLLAVERSVSDLVREDFPEDLTPLREEDVLAE